MIKEKVDNIKGFKVFPIYKIKIDFKVSEVIGDKSTVIKEDSYTHTYMPKEEMTSEDRDKMISSLWDQLVAKEMESDSPRDIEFLGSNSSLEGYDSWKLTWFSHMTYDLGQSDEEVLRSFEDFVSRNEYHGPDMDLKASRCLMGAEDRWRWRGEKDDSPAPCRCEGCKNHELIRINH